MTGNARRSGLNVVSGDHPFCLPQPGPWSRSNRASTPSLNDRQVLLLPTWASGRAVGDPEFDRQLSPVLVTRARSSNRAGG